MKTYAIVSSYSESCGNAAFTGVLARSIAQQYGATVEIGELNLKLTQSLEGNLRKKANKHIQTLCKQLARVDMVNIQLENILYGVLPGDVIKRLRWLIKANPNTTVTVHSPRLITENLLRRLALKQVLTGHPMAGFKTFMSSFYTDLHIKLNRRIIQLFAEHNTPLIVHTTRAQQQIKALFDYNNVTVHPLRIIDNDTKIDPSLLAKSKRALNLKETDVVVGMFGYLTSNKGHVDALKALNELPKNYKLFIYGRQHPQTIRIDGSVDGYLTKLMDMVKKLQLHDRVFFMGELNDHDFFNVAGSVDICWLPYYENGQDGSGIASITFDVNPRVLASASFAFDELFKLIKYNNVDRFDIGNYLEIARKTTIMLQGDKPQQPYAQTHDYTIATQAMTYAEPHTWVSRPRAA